MTSAERGQDAVEYGILLAVIAVVVLVGVAAFGPTIASWFGELAARITSTGRP